MRVLRNYNGDRLGKIFDHENPTISRVDYCTRCGMIGSRDETGHVWCACNSMTLRINKEKEMEEDKWRSNQ